MVSSLSGGALALLALLLLLGDKGSFVVELIGFMSSSIETF